MLWFNSRTGELVNGPRTPRSMVKVGYWADDRNHGIVERVWHWNFYAVGAPSQRLSTTGFLPVELRKKRLPGFHIGVMKRRSGLCEHEPWTVADDEDVITGAMGQRLDLYELVLVERSATFPVKPAAFEFAEDYLAEKRDAYLLFTLTRRWSAVKDALSKPVKLAFLLERHAGRLWFPQHAHLVERLPDAMRSRMMARLLCEN